MRIVVAAALLGFTVPAWAQAPAPPAKPSAPAAQSKKPPATNAAKNGYDAMSLAERAALQFDLIWTGDFNGIADGVWSERSLAAVKAYQKRKGGKESGALTDEERAALAAAAKAKQDEVGWRIVNDDSGARLGVPDKLVPQSAKGKSGGHWQSAHGEVQIDVFRERAPATLRIVYDNERKNPSRKIEYNVLRPDFFVISGLQGLKKFYMRAQASGNEVRGVLVRYDQAVEGIMDPVVVAISGAFTPFPSAAQAGAGPASKRMVEYGSGVIVGASGEIVTDRDTVDGCQTVVAAGIGNAERVSDDQQSGLALLRVYGVRELKPLALGAAPGADIVLVGIADPQSQDGKAAISTVKVRVQASGGSPAIDPPPPPGLAGAAAIDAEAGFVGIAVRRPQVVAGPASGGAATVLAPVDAIRRLLGASGAATTSGRASVDFAKDSVIRVICVRK
jgi:hypothetical protein